jgi:hypothetical protein
MARIGIGNHGLALALSARSDIRSFYLDCSHEAHELDNKATELLLSKGIYVRAPYTDIPEKVEFVKKQGFLGDLLGEQRPLLAVESTDDLERYGDGVNDFSFFGQINDVSCKRHPICWYCRLWDVLIHQFKKRFVGSICEAFSRRRAVCRRWGEYYDRTRLDGIGTSGGRP